MKNNLFLCRLTLFESYQNPANFTKETWATIDEHARYLDNLGKQGALILAGRTLFEPGDARLFGIALFNASDIDEVEAYRDQDPAYQQRIQNWEILPFSMGIRHLENAKR